MSTQETFRLSRDFPVDAAEVAARVLGEQTGLIVRYKRGSLGIEVPPDYSADARLALRQLVADTVGIESLAH